jgi:glutamate racemase
VDWIDPAPAIARRTSDLLGPPVTGDDVVRPRFLFTSGRQSLSDDALTPFFHARAAA